MKHYITHILWISLFFTLSACGDEETDTTTNTSEVASESMNDTMSEAAGAESSEMSTGTGSWGDECSTNNDCSAESPLCVINPMVGPPGYCSKPCTSTTQCVDTLDGWTCNIIGQCDSPTVSWCGPNEEIAEGGGVLIECP